MLVGSDKNCRLVNIQPVDKFVHGSRAARAGEDYGVVFARVDRRPDDVPRLVPVQSGLQGRDAGGRVGVAVGRQNFLNNEVFDKSQTLVK